MRRSPPRPTSARKRATVPPPLRDRLALARPKPQAATLRRAHAHPQPQPQPRTDARTPRRPGRPRAPQRCTVGYGYYPASDQRVPTLRLRGRWLEQQGSEPLAAAGTAVGE
ncbi:type I toxin-antitoxin system SymE family toxin [Xanthomonas hydrangeae]|uniref:Type I toxin-antitoxin system SymE family toxin n=1 Tax=Xanthomonas hydrangeae TaxID=2775159 RepID=A0AAU0BGG1_9XANT|nr:SymE family type I addiction module toxin [Xanthomonas hydrangeae]WOB51305.1 type I toxin-antitoxin system SymE family toxin [Xanthomonas hydrangeae]